MANTPTCGSLPEWPTLPELKDAGFITDVDAATIAVGVFLGVAGFLSFLPQIIAFIQVKSVQGASGLTIAFSMLSTNLQFAAIMAAGSPRWYGCKSLSSWGCFTNTLASQQIFEQALGATGVFAAYFFYWYKNTRPQRDACFAGAQDVGGSFASSFAEETGELGGNRGRMATVGILSTVISIIGMIGAGVVAFTSGPCASQTLSTQNLIGGVATIVQFLVWVPQILLLYTTKEQGSLSLLTVFIQAIGGLIFVVDLALEQAQLVSILPFVAVFVECAWILLMAWYYKRHSERRRRSEALSLQ